MSSAAPSGVSPFGVPGHNGFPVNTWNLKANFGFANSGIDRKKWTSNWLGQSDLSVTAGFQPKYDQNCFNPKNTSVASGVLFLSAIAGTCVDQNHIKYPYSGGMVSSAIGGTYSYGYFEAKIYLPESQCAAGQIPTKQFICINNHPAFWLTSFKPYSDVTVEIDIAEGLQGRMCQLTHFTAPRYVDRNIMHCSTVGPAGWRVYGALWTPGLVRFYEDGKLTYATKTPPGFTNPVYIILNNSVPTEWTPRTPSVMKVAYVRVWKQST